MSKKIFFVSGTLFLIILALFLWRSYSDGTLLSGKKTEIKTEKKGSDLLQSEEVKKQQEGALNPKKIQKIIDSNIVGAVFIKDEKKIVYYSNQNFMRADSTGQNKESAGAHPFRGVEKINWSSGKEKALVKDGSGYFVFDYKKEEVVSFPVPTDLMVWGTLNGQFLYEYFDQKRNKRILDASFDLTGATWEEITDIPYEKATVLNHPVKNVALLFPNPSQSASGDVFKVDISNKKKEKFLSYYKGMDFLFSPSGKKILESYVKSDGRISLGIVDWETGAFQDLNFPTSVKKCVWKSDETEVVCAAILSAEKVNLPEDWENRNGSFQDIFWRVNVQNGKQTRLLDLGTEEPTDAENLFFDETEERLFFVDRISGGLFRVNLPTEENVPENQR